MDAGCTWTRLSHASVSMGPCSTHEPEAASTESYRRMQFWPNLSQGPSLLKHFHDSLLSRDTHWDDSIHSDSVLCQLLGKHAHLPGTESSQRPQIQRGS